MDQYDLTCSITGKNDIKYHSEYLKVHVRSIDILKTIV